MPFVHRFLGRLRTHELAPVAVEFGVGASKRAIGEEQSRCASKACRACRGHRRKVTSGNNIVEFRPPELVDFYHLIGNVNPNSPDAGWRGRKWEARSSVGGGRLDALSARSRVDVRSGALPPSLRRVRDCADGAHGGGEPLGRSRFGCDPDSFEQRGEAIELFAGLVVDDDLAAIGIAGPDQDGGAQVAMESLFELEEMGGLGDDLVARGLS